MKKPSGEKPMDESLRIAIVPALIILMAILAGSYFVVRYLIRYFREESIRSYTQMLDSLEKSKTVLGKISYTTSEWDHVFQQEFSESIFGSYFRSGGSRRKKYDISAHEGKVYFFHDVIIITNRQHFKKYKFNEIRPLGYGSYLISIDLRKSSNMDILEIKTTHVGTYPASGGSTKLIGVKEIYKIPIPKSAAGKIEKIIMVYKNLENEDVLKQNFPDLEPVSRKPWLKKLLLGLKKKLALKRSK